MHPHALPLVQLTSRRLALMSVPDGSVVRCQPCRVMAPRADNTQPQDNPRGGDGDGLGVSHRGAE